MLQHSLDPNGVEHRVAERDLMRVCKQLHVRRRVDVESEHINSRIGVETICTGADRTPANDENARAAIAHWKSAQQEFGRLRRGLIPAEKQVTRPSWPAAKAGSEITTRASKDPRTVDNGPLEINQYRASVEDREVGPASSVLALELRGCAAV